MKKKNSYTLLREQNGRKGTIHHVCEMSVKRRVYKTSDGLRVKVDQELGLPKDKWLPIVLELACALGVSSEFPNSHRLFQRWTHPE